MYAWYFPKGFQGDFSSRRHDWASAVVWIDNPALDAPELLGVSTLTSDSKYEKIASAPEFAIGDSFTVHLNHCAIKKMYLAAEQWLPDLGIHDIYTRGEATKEVEAHVQSLCRSFRVLDPVMRSAGFKKDTAVAEVDGDSTEDNTEESRMVLDAVDSDGGY
ncbi:hypothetical protein BBJ29_007956 [Phytophthora kernoviae]|uniref:Uncharacterized protein n=1 Tax=Phytophthora kernoviae TaxID=325452 RepID=A0A3F2RRU2_9STRA|nr:hypothetical protein BBP00_00004944 [Phytophthora kernoviae]RLN68935.1 hypothetical protein BBJ29_007956 [Phytophthora kernoviae]